MALIDLGAFQPQPPSIYPDGPCTLRIWYDRDFLDSSGISVQGGPNFYITVTCMVTNGAISVPTSQIYSTLDAEDPFPQSIVCFAQFYTNNNTRKRDMLFTENSTPTGWVIPNPTPLTAITFEQLTIYNQATVLVNPPETFLTAQEVLALFNSTQVNVDASDVVKGITYLSDAPLVSASPRAVGVNNRSMGDFYNIAASPYYAATTKTAAQNATAIAAAVAAASAAGGGIYVPVGTFATNSVTISVPIDFAPGSSILAPATGQTVTITRAFSADLSQHFGNATAGLGTISFATNGDIVEVYPQWWGALADKTGTTGSDSGPAVQAAIVALESADGIGVLKLTGQFVCFNTTPNSTVLLVTKAMIIKGVGRSYSGLFAGTTTPITTDVLTYKPIAASFPANDGLCIQDTTIGVAEAVPNTTFSIWSCNNPSARHAVVLDDSLTSGNLAIRYLNIERCNLLANYANGISAGNYGLYSNGTNSANGCPSFASIVRQNLIYNGIFMVNLGDSFDFSNNDVRVYNKISVSQVSGASTCRIQRNVVSSRGGVVVGLAVNLSIDNNIIELNEPDVTGTDGAVISIQGPVFGGLISNNTINNQGAAPALNLIRINETTTSIKLDANTFFGQAGKFWLDHNSGTVFFGTSTAYPTNLAAPFTTSAPLSLNFIMNSLYQMPAVGTGYAGNVSQVGNARFIGVASAPVTLTLDNRDTAQSAAAVFSEVGVTTGVIGQVGSAFATAGRRGDIELFNATAGGGVAFWTNSLQRAEFDASGNMLWNTDNTLDIGASGATRPRTGYFGTSVVTPTLTAATAITTPSLSVNGGTALTSSNQTGTGSLVLATSPTLVTPALGVATATSVTAATALAVAATGKLATAPKVNDTWGAAISLDVSISSHDITAVFATSATATITPTGAGTAGDWIFINTINGAGGSVVVTFASTFHSSGTQTTQASRFSSIAFRSTGTVWVEQYRTTDLA